MNDTLTRIRRTLALARALHAVTDSRLARLRETYHVGGPGQRTGTPS